MSDLIEATESSLTRKVGDADCTFAFLTAYDRAELLRADLAERQRAHEKRRARVAENLKLAGISGEQMFAELEAFDDREPLTVTEQDWIAFVNDPTREVAIFAASLRAKHADKADELAKLSRLTLNEKAKVCGLAVVTTSRDSAQDDPSPNPQTPPIPQAYGTTGAESDGAKPSAGFGTGSPA